MICKICGKEITSEKVFMIHVKKCALAHKNIRKADSESVTLSSKKDDKDSSLRDKQRHLETLLKRDLMKLARAAGIKTKVNNTRAELINELMAVEYAKRR